MKKIVFLITTIISLNASESMFYDCLSTEKLRKDKQYALAKDSLLEDLTDCYQFPMGEKYEACKYQAQVNFEEEQDLISKDFRKRQRACFRENL